MVCRQRWCMWSVNKHQYTLDVLGKTRTHCTVAQTCDTGYFPLEDVSSRCGAWQRHWAHTHTYTHTHSLSHTRMRAHTHTHTDTRVRMQTQTQCNTLSLKA